MPGESEAADPSLAHMPHNRLLQLFRTANTNLVVEYLAPNESVDPRRQRRVQNLFEESELYGAELGRRARAK
jgi:hypothetical protein